VCLVGEYHKPYNGDVMKNLLFFVSALLLSGNCFASSADYSEATTAGDFVFVSGQVPIDPTTGQMMTGTVDVLTDAVIDSIEHWLKVKGCTLKQVVKTQVYLGDIRDFAAMDAAYAERFNFEYPPARDAIQAGGLLNNAPVEISCIAYKPRLR
jgi:2-iminobutanoate/2-iminopropanoate deaminase